MAKLDRLEIAKVVVAPSIALFVAAVGWVLTSRYNSTQIEVAAQRGTADIEIARINAAMRYMELVRNLPEDAAVQRRQAIAVAAPVLPPDLAFRLAIDELPDDTDAIDALMHKYEQGAFPYLARFLELPFPDAQRALDPSAVAEQRSSETRAPNRRASDMLRYLRERGHSKDLFNYLVSPNYGNDTFRPVALALYFHDYQASLRGAAGYVVQQAYERVRVEEEFQSYMRDYNLTPQARQSVAFAAALVFGQRYQYQSDLFVREAAARFWEGADVAHGATPVEGSLRAALFEQHFHYNNPPGTDDWFRAEAALAASASLRDTVRRLNRFRLQFENIRLILYGYAASPTVGHDPAYLAPADFVEVMKYLLAWADTPARRQELSMELGSLTGHHLFLNMLPGSQPKQQFAKEETDQACCAAARAYSELLLEWYGRYHASDWYIPKFFHDVAVEFPDLESRINRPAWGLGSPAPSDSSRGCRK